MSLNTIELEIYNPEEQVTLTLTVEQLSDNSYKALENDILNKNLTFGTEFETQVNENGQHEITKILKVSDYITKQFFLTTQFKDSEYRLLGDEIVKIGGFWQVDFGSFATINIPKEQEAYIEEIFKTFNFER